MDENYQKKYYQRVVKPKKPWLGEAKIQHRTRMVEYKVPSYSKERDKDKLLSAWYVKWESK